MAEYNNLHDLLVLKLKSLYDIEQQLVKAIPKMAKAATSEELKSAFEDHLDETQEHVSRLEDIFKQMDSEPEAEEGEAIRGLISDAEWCIKNIENEQVLDASLISAAQSVEHYEMAEYGSAAQWAEQLNLDEVKEILGTTLEEEEMADEKLTTLAESKVNEEAIMGMEEIDERSKKGFLGRSLETGNI